MCVHVTNITYFQDLIEFYCHFVLKHEENVIRAESFDRLDKKIRDDFLIKIDVCVCT